MEHIMKLQPKYFNCIKNGSKTIELRLYDEKRKLIKIGDTIKFLKEPEKTETLIAKVEALLIYPNFESILNNYDISIFSDNDTTKLELLKALNTFYTIEDQNKYGVLGIKVNV